MLTKFIYLMYIYLNKGNGTKASKKRRETKTLTTSLQNAINKARRIKCTVKVLSGRAYLVTTPQQHAYIVRFEQINGLRYGRCNCKAGVAGMACYHLPKAALVDTGIRQMRGH